MRYSPFEPAADTPFAELAAKVADAADPEGTLVRLNPVSLPVLASYAAQQGVPPIIPYGVCTPPIE